jgi:hypothetical protein
MLTDATHSRDVSETLLATMAMDLEKLNEQLQNLKIVYKDAIYSDLPLKDIKKISDQIYHIEELIAKRKALINRDQSLKLRASFLKNSARLRGSLLNYFL